VFRIAGRDLSSPISTRKAAGVTDAMLEQWETEASGKERKRGIPPIPYTKYRTIPQPDRAPLSAKFDPHSKRKGGALALPDPLASLS